DSAYTGAPTAATSIIARVDHSNRAVLRRVQTRPHRVETRGAFHPCSEKDRVKFRSVAIASLSISDHPAKERGIGHRPFEKRATKRKAQAPERTRTFGFSGREDRNRGQGASCKRRRLSRSGASAVSTAA